MDQLLNAFAAVIAYSHTLSAASLGMSCGAMGILIEGYRESSSSDVDSFIARAAGGLSVTAIFSLVWFMAAGAARIFFLIRAGAGGFQAAALAGGAVLLLPVCFGPVFWLRLGRAVSRLKAKK